MRALMIGLLASLFGVQLLADLGWAPNWLPGLATLLVLVMGFLTMSRGDGLRWPVAVVAFLGVAVMALEWRMGAGQVNLAAALFMPGLALIAVRLLRNLFAPGEVTRARIAGAIALYLVMALFFATAYEAIAALIPGAFVTTTSATTFASFRYFSIVTQTTTGYGDIVPAAPVARTLVMLQAVAGQMFVAVVIARLVALHISPRER
jgi:voltage-gated potassium channel Kch